MKRLLESVECGNDAFQCPICLSLVYEPHQCPACELAVFCGTCVQTILKKECPSCRAQPFTPQRINRLGLRLLEGSEARAPCQCQGVKPTYGEVVRHLEVECGEPQVECGLCRGRLSRAQSQGHWAECGGQVVCRECDTAVKVSEVREHDCIRCLRLKLDIERAERESEVDWLKRELSEAHREIERLTRINRELAPIVEDVKMQEAPPRVLVEGPQVDDPRAMSFQNE